MTLWTLDTCGFSDKENCQIFINDATGEESFVRKCPAHTNVADSNVSQVHEENTRGQGNALGHILDNAPTALFDTQADGSRTFKRGITVDWSWTGTVPNRALTINISGISLTANQKTALQAKVDERFGAGKVALTFG